MASSSSSSSSSEAFENNSQDSSTLLLPRVATELETLRCMPLHDGADFPLACRAMLYSLPGNAFCVDCGSPGPDWCSVTYGVLLCVQCSGRHRSYGVQTSFVRSITMDAWSHTHVLAMLEGGNQQLHAFFERHRMGTTLVAAAATGSGNNNKISDDRKATDRYHTKAALFYGTNLKMHAQVVAESGRYQGREYTRQHQKERTQQQQQQHRQTTQQQPTQPLVERDHRRPIAVGDQ